MGGSGDYWVGRFCPLTGQGVNHDSVLCEDFGRKVGASCPLTGQGDNHDGVLCEDFGEAPTRSRVAAGDVIMVNPSMIIGGMGVSGGMRRIGHIRPIGLIGSGWRC